MTPNTPSPAPEAEIPTPRCDSQVANKFPHAKYHVNIDFARQLERELAATQAQLAEAKEQLVKANKQASR